LLAFESGGLEDIRVWLVRISAGYGVAKGWVNMDYL
jgi:hypothetical protein